ncbi:MAG: ABC transporter substrate-binding protein [Nitrospiria bacterium]
MRTVSLVICIVLFSCLDASQVDGAEIGLLKSQDLPIYREALEGIKKVYRGDLREFDLKADPQESQRVVMALKRDPPDLILTIGLWATRVAKENFQQTPIIFSMVFDPDRFSLSGENITGVTLEVSASEVFSRIRDLFPEVKRIGVLYNPKKTGERIEQAEKAARVLGVSLISVPVRSEKDVPEGLRTLQPQIDLLWLVPDSTVVTPESVDFLLLTSFENNIPIVTFSDGFVRRGAAASFSPDYRAVGEQSARLALSVLQGENPVRLSIRPTEKIRLSFNVKIVKKMGIRFNPKVLQTADKIYD